MTGIIIKIIILAIVVGVELALYIKQCKNPEASKRYDEIVEKILNEKSQEVKEVQKDEAN